MTRHWEAQRSCVLPTAAFLPIAAALAHVQSSRLKALAIQHLYQLDLALYPPD